MQLASITFDGEKKNSRHFIIPPSFFEKKGIKPVSVTIPNKEKNDPVPVEQKTTETQNEETPSQSTSHSLNKFQVNQPVKIELKQDLKRASGLSLKSLKVKKEHLIKQMDVVIDEENLPKEPFTEAALIQTWKDYVALLQNDGKHNLASILSIDTPKVKDTVVYLEFPNATNKVELERNQYELLLYIRKALNNFDINLSISVNEEMEKQYAYTPFEKFEKLKAKNPNIDVLRKIFDLDI
jgi:DNA polymerase-3 subunit gamma/tau